MKFPSLSAAYPLFFFLFSSLLSLGVFVARVQEEEKKPVASGAGTPLAVTPSVIGFACKTESSAMNN